MSEQDPFVAIAEARLRELAVRGTLRNFRRGSVLIQEGDEGSTLYILLKGRLKAYAESADGKGREITYGVYGAGDLIGEMSLDGGTRSASVMALEASVCAVVTKETVRAFIREQPDFAFDLLARVIARARRATQSARNMVLTDAYGRLSEFLITHAGQNQHGLLQLNEKYSHAQLASYIGCSREMVSRLLKDLEMGGYLEKSADGMLVLRKALPAHW